MVEIFAVVFTALSVYLTSKSNIWCWPIGILAVIFYFIVFRNLNDIMNMCLQFVFLFQSVFGWINWNKSTIDVSYTKKGWIIFSSFLIILMSIILYFLTKYLSGNDQLLDPITTSISLIALTLTSLRKIESWYFWILADVLFVIMFFNNGLYLSSLIYFVFSIIAIYGLKNWKNEFEKIQ